MRWPCAALVMAAALLWVDALAGGRLSGSAPALAVIAGLAVVAGMRSAPLPLISSCVATSVLLAVADQIGSPGRFSLASDGLFYAVMVSAPALIGWLVGERNRQVAELIGQRHDLELRRAIGVRLAHLRDQQLVRHRIDLALAGRFRDIIAGAEGVATARVHARDIEIQEGLARLEHGAREALKELRHLLDGLQVTPVAKRELPEPVAAATQRRRRDVIDVLLVMAAIPLAVETALPGHRGLPWLNAVAALAQGPTLVLARRRPTTGVAALFAVACLQTAFLAPLPPTVSWLIPGLLAAFLAGAAARRATALRGLLVIGVGIVGLTAATPAAHRSPSGLLPSLVIGLLGWTSGRVVAARDRRTRELRALADELARSADQETELAVFAQRAEMTRELHDVGAHALTVVCLQAGAAQAWWTRDQNRALTAVDAVTRYAAQSLNPLAVSLARPGAGDQSEPPTAIDLEVLAESGRALGLHIDLFVPTGWCARDEIAWAAYRIVQEALTNSARHASGTNVDVRVAVVGDYLEVGVVDDGRSLHSPSPVAVPRGAGLGLRGMHDRVTALGGELTTGPTGTGFEVRARLPI